MNELINHKHICRTAPATLGQLKTYKSGKCFRIQGGDLGIMETWRRRAKIVMFNIGYKKVLSKGCNPLQEAGLNSWS